jgi:hypothetical protein
VLLVQALAGCGLFYDTSYRGARFTIYSDREPAFVEHVGKKVERIYRGYEALFALDPATLGRTTIILQGDETEPADADYSPSVLGYYIPLLNYISIDTHPAWARRDGTLQQILLHELAHHFLVTEFPQASNQCWLNEGLAGNLEVTLFDGQRFEYPLLNPALFQIAQAAIYDRQHPVGLGEFLDMSWREFHTTSAKERSYALAWSVVYFLLEKHFSREIPLGERIEALYGLDREAILALEDDWRGFLRGFDVTSHLLRLAMRHGADTRLSARWAVEELGNTRSLDDLRVLVKLVDLFEDPDGEKRLLAHLSFLKTLRRNPHSFFLCEDKVQEGLEHVARVLDAGGDHPAFRGSLAGALGDAGAQGAPKLVRIMSLLADEERELRAAGAGTLSRFPGNAAMILPSSLAVPDAPDTAAGPDGKDRAGRPGSE